jgi:anti-sigma B factor antagonist
MEHFTIQQSGDQTVVEFTTSSLSDPTELDRIGAELYRLVDEQDRRRIVLDFRRVEYMSSQTIGIILAMRTRLDALPHSSLVLSGVGPRLMELLKITRLDRLLTIKAGTVQATSRKG